MQVKEDEDQLSSKQEEIELLGKVIVELGEDKMSLLAKVRSLSRWRDCPSCKERQV